MRITNRKLFVLLLVMFVGLAAQASAQQDNADVQALRTGKDEGGHARIDRKGTETGTAATEAIQSTTVCGNITENTTWTLAGSPYVLTCDTTVTNGATLTIEPGVEVRGRGTVLATDNTGAIVANGTPGEPILFTSDDGTVGGWKGVYINGQGGTPPPSSLIYCIMEKGGGVYCPWECYYYANLSLQYVDNAMVSNCTFRNGPREGVRVIGCSPDLTSCVISGNASHGIFLSSSSPGLTGCQITNNATYGIYGENNGCNPVLTTCTISDNTTNPMRVGVDSIVKEGCTVTGNGAIEFYGGSRTTPAPDNWWYKFGCPYRLLGDVTVTGGTLQIEPAVEVRGQGAVLATDNTGAIVATGTPGGPILFTSEDGTVGGWKGIYLNGQGGTPLPSSLAYCIVEKGGGEFCPLGCYYYANLSLEYVDNATISNCTFRNGPREGVRMIGCSPSLTSCVVSSNAGYGINLSNASPGLTSCQITSNGAVGLYLSTASPSLTGCQITNNTTYGIYSANNGCNPVFTGCTISGNTTNPMRVCVNSIVKEDCTITGNGAIEFYGGSKTTPAPDNWWYKFGCPYRLLGDVTVTGVTLNVREGVEVRGQNAVLATSNTGAIVAIGTALQPILFTADNGLPSGWKGILIDGEGGGPSLPASTLSYCTVEKAGQGYGSGGWLAPAGLVGLPYGTYYFDLWLYYHSNVTVSHCTFRNSSGNGLLVYGTNPNLDTCTITANAGHGMYLSAASPGLTGCQITDNATYGIYSENNGCNPALTTCTISGNTTNPLRVGINTTIDVDTVISGPGCIEYWGGSTNASNRTWRYYAGPAPPQPVPYRILGDVIVRNRAALTIQAGNTVRFPGTGLFVGQYSANDPNDRGTLQATGTEIAPIIFTADNGTSGGWKGIVFDGKFDTLAARTPPASNMAWCAVEKAATQDVGFYYHSKVTMHNCDIRDGSGDGLLLTSSSPAASSALTGNRFEGNAGNGIRARTASSPGIADCHMENNGSHGLFCEDAASCPVIETSIFAGNTTAPMRIGLNSIFNWEDPLKRNTVSGNGSIEIHPGTTDANNRTWFKWAPPGRKHPGDYSLLGDIVVRNGATLTVEPGCVVTLVGQLIIGQHSGSSYDPTQRGALQAVGTPEAPIIFTSTNGQVGGWRALYFDARYDSSPMPSNLSHSLVEKGGSAGANTLEGYYHPAVTLSHCTVARCQTNGLKLTNSDWSVSNSILARNGGYGIQAVSSTPLVTCTDFWTNTSGDWTGFTPGTGCIQLDPKFWSLVDYHLQPDSPCCGTACDSTYMGAYPCGVSPIFDTYYAKTLPDGTEVELVVKTVTAGTEDFADCAYIEEVSRYSGLKIRKAVPFDAWEQDQVTTTGIMRTDGCERYMDALTVTYTGTADNPIRPMFMVNRTVGGPPAVALTSGGIPAPGAWPGLSNIGLLIKVSGKVTQVDSTNRWFFVADGSGRVGAGGNTGIKASLANLAGENVITLPFVGAQLTVTGISTIEQVGDEAYSIIRPRTQNDILYH